MKSWYVSAYPQGIQDVGDFISSVELKLKFFLKSVSHVMAVNGTHGFESKKTIHRQNQVKPCGLWRFIEVLIIARIVYTVMWPGCCECAQDSWTVQWIRGKIMI